MAKVNLTSGFVQNPPQCPAGKNKIDYYDSKLPGFLLEVRLTGRCTYYQRYKDKYGRVKQARIGHTNSLSLEDARVKAKQIRSQALMGMDMTIDQERLKAMPDLALFRSRKPPSQTWKTFLKNLDEYRAENLCFYPGRFL